MTIQKTCNYLKIEKEKSWQGLDGRREARLMHVICSSKRKISSFN